MRLSSSLDGCQRIHSFFTAWDALRRGVRTDRGGGLRGLGLRSRAWRPKRSASAGSRSIRSTAAPNAARSVGSSMSRPCKPFAIWLLMPPTALATIGWTFHLASATVRPTPFARALLNNHRGVARHAADRATARRVPGRPRVVGDAGHRLTPAMSFMASQRETCTTSGVSTGAGGPLEMTSTWRPLPLEVARCSSPESGRSRTMRPFGRSSARSSRAALGSRSSAWLASHAAGAVALDTCRDGIPGSDSGSLLIVVIWAEIYSSWVARIFGALAVALAAFLLVIPVLLVQALERQAPASARPRALLPLSELRTADPRGAR